MTLFGLARDGCAEIHCDDAGGDGLPVLAFNGATLPLEIWDPLVERTADRLRWIRFDARNAGATRAAGVFSLEDIAADGAAALDHLGIDTAVIVGHAWGGRVAQVFARDHGERARAMVICGTGGRHPPALPADALAAVRRARRDEQRAAWDLAVADVYCGPAYPERYPVEFAALLDLLWSTPVRNSARWDPELSPVADWWGQTALPTLLLYGSADKLGTAENARDLHAAIIGSRLRMMEGAGHFLVRERAGEVALELMSFCQDLDHDDC